MANQNRRKLIKTLAAGGGITAVPTQWKRPVVNSLAVPAHAQLTGVFPCDVVFCGLDFGIADIGGSAQVSDGIITFQGDDAVCGGPGWIGSGPISPDGTFDVSADCLESDEVRRFVGRVRDDCLLIAGEETVNSTPFTGTATLGVDSIDECFATDDSGP